jgi:hypothetical protein
VRSAVSPGHIRPSGPKLSVLFRRNYVLSIGLILSEQADHGNRLLKRRQPVRNDGCRRSGLFAPPVGGPHSCRASSGGLVARTLIWRGYEGLATAT